MKIDVSLGELVDKVTILCIKSDRITDEQKLGNVRRELESLRASMREADLSEEAETFTALLDVNGRLWDVEDQLRRLEAEKRFDEEFIRLARDVFYLNDDRFEIKRRINLQHGSDMVEEKQYVEYRDAD